MLVLLTVLRCAEVAFGLVLYVPCQFCAFPVCPAEFNYS